MKRPQPSDYGNYYEGYVSRVQGDVIEELKTQVSRFADFMRQLPMEKRDFAYAEGKWTIKKMLGHILDTERILTYRLLRISRNDSLPLQGFDEDSYAANAESGLRNFDELIDEFVYLRKANQYLYESLSETQLNRHGTANGVEFTVLALLFIIAGHLNHHKAVIEERYL